MIYTYDEVKKESVDYFKGNDYAATVFVDKYALKNKEGQFVEKSPDDMHRRLAREFARIEKNKFKNPYSEEDLYSYFKEFKRIMAQGSPYYGIGNDFQLISISNCFVIEDVVDSYGGIFLYDEQLAQISKRRGGVGGDVSRLRPSGARTNNAAHSSTGMISFMCRFSNTIREVGQNGRRGAEMITVSIHHPESVIPFDPKTDVEHDIEIDNTTLGQYKISSKYFNPEKIDFATSKYDESKVTGANISLRLSDEFLKALENDEEFEQRWPVDKEDYEKAKGEGKFTISKKVRAKDVWEKIIYSAWRTAEPGILFWDNIIKESIPDCYEKFGFKTLSTNPCGEIPLSAFDSCRLMALNLFGFVVNPYKKDAYFDYVEFYKYAQIAQRLMDDMIDLEVEKIKDIIKKIKKDPEEDNIKRRELELWQNILKFCELGRRTGLGITALGNTIAAIGVKYGSDESISVVNKIYQTLKFGSYRSSVDMAKELGPFKVWDWNLEMDNPFLLRIRRELLDLDIANGVLVSGEELYNDMAKYGRRNIANLTTAPTGSISSLAKLAEIFGSTSGIEPEFSIKEYIRKKKGNPGDNNFRVDSVDQNGDSWMHFTISPSSIQDWRAVTGEEDSSKSPYFGATAVDLDWKQRVILQATAQRHIDHSISSTVNLPNSATFENVAEIYETAWKMGCKGITIYRDGCRTGVLVRKDSLEPKIKKNNAPKRPLKLPCDVHHCTKNGHRYLVVVGVFSGDPYEVFINNNHDQEGDIIVPKTVEKGYILKNGRGKYSLSATYEGEEKDYKLTNGQSDENMDTVTRLVSTSLRHGADIAFVVHQLEKTQGNMQSFTKVLSRILKKYVKDGTKVCGESCPQCGSELFRQDGCPTCKSCGYAKC